MAEFIAALIRFMVSRPEAVAVAASEEGRDVTLEAHVAAEDVGRVIGRQGRTVRALRTVLAAASRDSGRDYHLEVLDGAPE